MPETSIEAGYPPFDVLKPVDSDIWIVDGRPLRTLGLAIPVRMTVVRLASGAIWLHSPTAHSPELQRQIEALGPIRALVAPNIGHWMFLKDWQRACGKARTFAVPMLRRRPTVKRSGVVVDEVLGDTAPREWAEDIGQCLVRGGLGISEAAFFHRPSRTLILADLVQNFEPEKTAGAAWAALTVAGSMAPDGKAPIHLRFVMRLKRDRARQAASRMIEWAPERVIFAHGRWFDRNGSAELRRSLRWLMR